MPIIKHPFISGKADGGDSTLVKPSDWNDEHTLVSEGAPVYLGRTDTGAGDIMELPLSGVVGDDYTVWTKAQVQAAIAAALVGIDIPVPGDLSSSLAAAKTGWLLCNGQTVGNVGSGADFASANAHNLFLLLWGLNGNTWPGVLPARGASAAADWTALKKVPVPDARGCVIAMRDLAAGVNALVVNLGIKVGTSKILLTRQQMPSHNHGLPDPLNIAVRGNLGGVGGGQPMNYDPAHTPVLVTALSGGDPDADPPNSVPLPVNPTQPTIGANIFIKY